MAYFSRNLRISLFGMTKGFPSVVFGTYFGKSAPSAAHNGVTSTFTSNGTTTREQQPPATVSKWLKLVKDVSFATLSWSVVEEVTTVPHAFKIV